MHRPFKTIGIGLSLPSRGLLISALALAVYLPAATGAPPQAPQEHERQLARARREVKLLDDIYKTAIVLITKHYVDDKSNLAAGEAFKVLFAGMKERGWHEVRLLAATDQALNDENMPQDEFERNAVKALLAGKAYYEEEATKAGKHYLRAATPIPIVMEKCTLCHDNYRDQKVIGALGYTLPLDPDAKLAK